MFRYRNQNQYFPNAYQGQMPDSNPYYFNLSPRNYPYPDQGMPQQAIYQWPQQTQPYYPGGMQQFPQQVQQQIPSQQHYPTGPHMFPQKDSQFLFQNPLQPQDDSYFNPYMNPQSPQSVNQYGNANPYPQTNTLHKQSGGMQSIMKSFKSQDGSVDFNKMMNTAGQMMNAVNQVSSLVKGFGGFFKV